MTNLTRKTRLIKRLLWGLVGMFLLLGVWQLVADNFREEEKDLRSQLRNSVKKAFPQQTEKFSKTLGLLFYETSNQGIVQGVALDRKSVVLVHGLDDPGKVWNSLAPELVESNFNVWLMQYPNDQPIAESARLLCDELQGLRKLGINRISLVAHSMGGLVSREMLTRPVIDYAQSAQNRKLPEVAALIMVGTPNHGSQLVRFRLFAEVRDQFTRLVNGEASWLAPILDGGGEAKIDLLPGSRFLNELNARPPPVGVDMLVIAGVSSPLTKEKINRWKRNLEKKITSDEKKKWLDELGQTLVSMTHGLGDGLVTVESARLEGVPLKIVPGTHLSMIRNVTSSSQRIPPAVPIIVNYLKK
jgi:pimeloyl-ACP methyl ester carboxylesterase